MSLCINPRCPQPDHEKNDGSPVCHGCGSDLLLLGRYRVMRLLNDSSGFSQVYEVFDRTTPKILKVLKPTMNSNPKAIELFQQEAIVLSQLPHPGIPAIEPQSYFEFFPHQGQPLHCLLMEKIDGPNLREWMQQQGNHPIGEKQAVQWLKQLAEILHLIHQQNYFHRDIKPDNIMLRSSGQLVLVDFGAAREITYTYLAQLGKSGEMTRISSAGYTPPEQERGQAVPQSDFYALGCTFVYLLTGKLPTDPSLYDSLHNELHWRPLASHISLQLASFIDRLIAPRASDRPANTADLLMMLDRLEAELFSSLTTQLNGPASLEPFPISTLVQPDKTQSAASTPPPFTKPIESKRWLWSGVALLLVLAGGYGVWQVNPMQQIWGNATSKTLSPQSRLIGHTGEVRSLALTSNGRTLISGSADYTIRVWEFATGHVLQILSGHSGNLNALAVSPDNKILASGSADQTIKLWNLATGQELRTLTGHTSYVNVLAITPDGKTLVSGSADQTIKLWNLATGELLQTLTGHTSYVNALAITPDGKTLASGSADQTIKLWNLATGELLQILTGHQGYVESIAIRPDGRVLLSGSSDQTVKLWDLTTGKEQQTLTGLGIPVKQFVLAPNRHLLTGGNEGEIQVWQLP